jgi:predicted GNAT family N-acyltransferase
MSNIIIRHINDDELDKMYALRHAVLRVPLGLSLYTQDFSTEKTYIKIGAFLGKQLVGCVMVELMPNDVAKIRQMAVDAQFQHQGIGKQLMYFAEEDCRKFYMQTIMMHARISAKPFYESLQYIPIGKEFVEVNIPHIEMQKSI